MPATLRPSSGNVFADLGFGEDEAQNLKIRSDVMIELAKLVEDRGLTQVAAAELLGVTQPRVSDLVRGKIDCLQRRLTGRDARSGRRHGVRHGHAASRRRLIGAECGALLPVSGDRRHRSPRRRARRPFQRASRSPRINSAADGAPGRASGRVVSIRVRISSTRRRSMRRPRSSRRTASAEIDVRRSAARSRNAS